MVGRIALHTAPPRSVGELRLWLLGGEELAASLASACEVEVLDPARWSEQMRNRPAHLLLVEGGESREPGWDREIAGLLDACGEAGVPRILWIVFTPLDESWLELGQRFERVFTVDPLHFSTLKPIGGEKMSLLRNATGLPIDDRPVTGTASRPDPVVWVGGWREDWAPEWKAHLLEILRAASHHDLRIAGVAEPELLPAELRPFVAADDVAYEEALRRARVVIAADRLYGSTRIVPRVALDGIACGAAVVSAHEFVPRRIAKARPMGISFPVDEESADADFRRLLGDDERREEIVNGGRRTIAYNHTYAHRAATLASTVGYRLVVDAAPGRGNP